MRYLYAVSRRVPEALDELRAIDPGDDRALEAWARRRGFSDHWALWTVRNHLPVWRDNPESFGRWLTVFGGTWEPVPPPAPIWNPFKETEAAYAKRHAEYLNQVRQLPATKTPEKEHGDRDFEWLALVQVGGVERSEIAINAEGDDALSLGTVSEALKSTAAMIGLTLRPAKRGPRRKTSEQSGGQRPK